MRKLAIAIGVTMWMLAGAGAHACEGTDVLYEDNFESLDSTWGNADDSFYLKDGRLVVTPDLDKYYAALSTAGVYDDIDYCVRIYSLKADPKGNTFAGVIFWATDYDNYYYALIAGDGAVAVFRRQRGKVLQQVDWTAFGAVKKGDDAVNNLRVVTVGKQASIYVNGQLFRDVTGQPPPNGQQIGVRAISAKNLKAIYAFDDIKITDPAK
jgi:hypothetical protein